VTDEELVRKRLAFIETCIAELRARGRPEAVGSDIVATRFVEHTLQIAIQATQDVASHIVAADRLGEPTENAALFAILVRAGWLRQEQGSRLRQMVGFRNVLVHGYAEVDPAVVVDVLVHRLGDLEGFVRSIRGRLEGS
jgi:uncharacterized protein YutE (UPF0331/DUF86 family)